MRPPENDGDETVRRGAYRLTLRFNVKEDAAFIHRENPSGWDCILVSDGHFPPDVDMWRDHYLSMIDGMIERDRKAAAEAALVIERASARPT